MESKRRREVENIRNNYELRKQAAALVSPRIFLTLVSNISHFFLLLKILIYVEKSIKEEDGVKDLKKMKSGNLIELDGIEIKFLIEKGIMVK